MIPRSETCRSKKTTISNKKSKTRHNTSISPQNRQPRELTHVRKQDQTFREIARRCIATVTHVPSTTWKALYSSSYLRNFCIVLGIINSMSTLSEATSRRTVSRQMCCRLVTRLGDSKINALPFVVLQSFKIDFIAVSQKKYKIGAKYAD